MKNYSYTPKDKADGKDKNWEVAQETIFVIIEDINWQGWSSY